MKRLIFFALGILAARSLTRFVVYLVSDVYPPPRHEVTRRSDGTRRT